MSTPVSTTIVPVLLSIFDVIWSFSPKHSNDSPSESDEHCDDFDGSVKGNEIKICQFHWHMIKFFHKTMSFYRIEKFFKH